jgi:hypothetical protein
LKRVEGADDMQTLATLRSALEEARGLHFEGEAGDHFFRSALVQTLFYGVFASWVFWSEQQATRRSICGQPLLRRYERHVLPMIVCATLTGAMYH